MRRHRDAGAAPDGSDLVGVDLSLLGLCGGVILRHGFAPSCAFCPMELAPPPASDGYRLKPDFIPLSIRLISPDAITQRYRRHDIANYRSKCPILDCAFDERTPVKRASDIYKDS